MTHELPPSPVHRLEDILASFRALAALASPDVALEVADRSDLYFLITLLVEHLETCLHAIVHQIGDLHDTLRQAQADHPAPEETLL
jgi:hypothetical protein